MGRLFVGLGLIIVSSAWLGASLAIHRFGTGHDRDRTRLLSPVASGTAAVGAWLFFNGLDVITSD